MSSVTLRLPPAGDFIARPLTKQAVTELRGSLLKVQHTFMAGALKVLAAYAAIFILGYLGLVWMNTPYADVLGGVALAAGVLCALVLLWDELVERFGGTRMVYDLDGTARVHGPMRKLLNDATVRDDAPLSAEAQTMLSNIRSQGRQPLVYELAILHAISAQARPESAG